MLPNIAHIYAHKWDESHIYALKRKSFDPQK